MGDVILSTLGGLVGILGFQVLRLILRNEKHVRTTAAVTSLLGVPVLWYLLFVIKMRF